MRRTIVPVSSNDCGASIGEIVETLETDHPTDRHTGRFTQFAFQTLAPVTIDVGVGDVYARRPRSAAVMRLRRA